MLHLHEKFARDEKIAPEYVCVCVCVRAYVCGGCCNINARIKIDTREWVSGRDYGVIKSFGVAARQNQQSSCVPSEDSNQPGHPRSLIRVCAPSEDSNQPGHPPSLIRVFAGRFIGN